MGYWLLVGAGGHAQAVVEALVSSAGEFIDAYVDPAPADWLEARHIVSDAEAERLKRGNVVMGIGGVSPVALRRRLTLLRDYGRPSAGWFAPPVIHPSATISKRADIGAGVIVLAGAIVQPGASVGTGAIINTSATVEHDSTIGAGAHIAPGALVLGGCTVGEATMIGAGAVILPGTVVPDDALVPALTRYPV